MRLAETEITKEYYEELNLFDYLNLLKKNWVLLTLITLGAGLLAFIIIVIIPPVYETNVSVYFPTGETFMTLPAYTSFAQNRQVEKSIQEKLHLELENPSLNLSKAITATLQEKDRLLKIAVHAKDPILTEKIATEWYISYTDELRKFMQSTISKNLEASKNNVNSRYRDFQNARNKLTEFEKDYSVSLLQATLKSLEDEKVTYDRRIRELKTNVIEIDETKLKLLKEQESKEVKILNDNKSSAPHLADEISIINPLYLEIKGKLLEIELQLTANKAELKALEENSQKLAKEIEQLRQEVVQLKETSLRLKQEVATTNLFYEEARKQYEALFAKQWEQTEAALPQLIYGPNTEDNPVSPKKTMNVAIALFLGFFLGLMYIYMKEMYVAFQKA